MNRFYPRDINKMHRMLESICKQTRPRTVDLFEDQRSQAYEIHLVQ